MKPSDFKGINPSNSVFNKCEYEIVCKSIINISIRLGDKWGLTKEEYETERKKDGNYKSIEGFYAAKVLPYFQSVEEFKKFSPYFN